jgi:hypothetical protein
MQNNDTSYPVAVYAICNLLGMSSACLNPILYGFLNKTFRREFKNIFGLVANAVR